MVAPARPMVVPDATPLPARAPTRAPTREELVEKARRMAGPSPHREERVPPSPFTLPANPLAELPDDAIGEFVECMIYEQSEVYDVDSFAEPTEVQPIAFDPTSGSPPVSLAGPAAAELTPPMHAQVPTAPLVPPPFYVPPPPTAPRRTIAIVASASVVIGVIGGWILFGRGE